MSIERVGFGGGFVGIYCHFSEVENIFKPCNVIQSGAYGLNELGLYNGCKVKQVLFIEADPDNYKNSVKVLQEHGALDFKYRILNETLTEEIKQTNFYRFRGKGYTNSLLPPAPCLALGPEELYPVTTTTLDLITANDPLVYDTLMLDCQGAERFVLAGAQRVLKTVKFAFIEVWKPGKEGYAGSGSVTDIDSLLPDFQRLVTTWPGKEDNPFCTWGYAFYHRVK